MMNYFKYSVLLLMGCVLISCKKELNVYPTTSEVDGNVIVDVKTANTVLNGVYYRFAGAGTDYNQFPSVNWSDYNELVPSMLTGLVDYAGGGSEIGLYNIGPFNEASDLFWRYNYALVNAANGFLKNVAPVSKIPDATKKQMQAEARFLRAFANTQLLLYFGQYNVQESKYGIILRTEFVNADNINLPRTSVADAYAAIVSDIDFAITNLPEKNKQIYFANSWAAKLLMARLLINRAGPGDYAKVISLTSDLINNGPFQLEKNVKDIFLTKGHASKEVIMGVQPFPNQTYKFTEYQLYFQYAGTQYLADLLTNDPRSDWVYKKVVDPSYGELYQITKYYAGSTDPSDMIATPLTENGYAFRLTEAYLIQAEAITLSGGDISVAKTLLKTIKSHAGIADFSDIDEAKDAVELQDLIVREELKNFAVENGIDFFALRRLPFDRLQKIRPEVQMQSHLILPIPYAEMTTNPNIIQNPDYQ